MSAAPHEPRLVSADAFAAACASARSIRIQRFVLWRLGPKHTCCSAVDTDPDPPMVWNRVKEAIDCEAALCASTPGHAWLITEEHHDVLGNRYTPAGDFLEPTWQPAGPALLRTADNPTHWISVRRILPWHFMAPIAVSEDPRPADWSQPRKPHYQEENDVWVHFVPDHGPFVITKTMSKFQAPRHTTPAMCAFMELPDDATPSAADMTSAVVRYIHQNRLTDPSDSQRVIADQKLSALLGEPATFQLTELQRRLAPHYGEHA
jgi:hypothetical protein